MRKGSTYLKSVLWRRKKTCGFLLAMTLGLSMAAGCAQTENETNQTEDAGIDQENWQQAGLGGLTLKYDDTVWTYDETASVENSLVFTQGSEGVLGISYAQENSYQHPLSMIEDVKLFYSTFDGYEELEAPKEVEVNGERWYEWNYSFMDGGVENQVVRRFYAKNYHAYTVSYTALPEQFEAGAKQARQIMDTIEMSVPDNAQAEAKAKEFLVGEWDMGAAGYLVLSEDGTYNWYMKADKDEANMHTGTYGCDVENADLGFTEGGGIYLVLFPEVIYANGEAAATGSPKYDYGISIEQQEDGSYQMINVSTFNIYTLKKQQ